MDESTETVEIPESIYLQILQTVSKNSQNYNSVSDFILQSLEKELNG